MSRILTLIISCFFVSSLSAQQNNQYSMYMLNKYAFNPAYAGMEDYLSLTGVYRKQWINLNGSPESQNITAHLPLYYVGGGFGINVNNSMAGVHRDSRAALSYNHYLPMGENGRLSIGLSGGVVQQSYDGAALRAPEGTYIEPPASTFQHNDPFLPMGNVSSIAPTLGAGLYYKNGDLEIGFSADNLLESKHKFDLESGETNVQMRRHFYFVTSYRLDIGNYLSLSPSVFARADVNELQTEVSAILTYNENIFAGASLRGYNMSSLDAAVIIVGMKIGNGAKIAYAYDLGLSSLNTIQTGSHEITINYTLNKKIGAGIPPKIIYNPRYL